jgi:NAD(P)-dependent dehydrogenase (short-subunit alcohol dehydrogenase family)
LHLQDWDWLFNINVKGMFLVAKAIIPHMITLGGGSIVCTSSISAELATVGEVLYGATKGACHMFARAIAVEFKDRNIRCNAVCPGFINTPHGRFEQTELLKIGVNVSEEGIKEAQGRWCEPMEVAKAALFLLSDDASFVNGARLAVDGGFSAV